MITGSSGFLGSYVVERFRFGGIDPFEATRPAFDLVSPQATASLFRWVKPDIVIHLAAEVGGIGANVKNPGRFWYANLQMGLNVLEASRIFNVKKLVLVGTVCSYPSRTKAPFKEEDFWKGYPEETNAPYGVAKKALLVGAEAYRKQYGLNTIYLIPENLYGPRDNFDPETSHVIPGMIYKMLKYDDVVLWGDGTPTREFLHARDCAEAIWLATDKYNLQFPVNIGSGEEVSIAKLAAMIKSATEFKGEITWDKSKPNGQQRRCLDVSVARSCFGFEAKTRLADGLMDTVNWFRYG